MRSSLRKALATVSSLPAIVSIEAILAYQRTLSPDHGLLRHLFPHGYCRHEPTCSAYAVDRLRDRSLFVAYFLILRRILSCNPWTKPSDEKLKAVIERTLRKN